MEASCILILFLQIRTGSLIEKMSLDSRSHQLLSHHKDHLWILGQDPGLAGSLPPLKRRKALNPRYKWGALILSGLIVLQIQQIKTTGRNPACQCHRFSEDGISCSFCFLNIIWDDFRMLYKLSAFFVLIYMILPGYRTFDPLLLCFEVWVWSRV